MPTSCCTPRPTRGPAWWIWSPACRARWTADAWLSPAGSGAPPRADAGPPPEAPKLDPDRPGEPQTHGAHRRPAAECRGDGIERPGREAPPGRDRIHRLPQLGTQPGLEGVEAAEIVETPAVRPHPREEEPEPGRLRHRRSGGPAGKRREAQRRIARPRGGERAHH